MIFLDILLILHLSTNVRAHGILLEPPSRTSAWRVGFKTPAYYNDSETNCGGYERHHVQNQGRCGICGDPWDEPPPRKGEGGGAFGRGVIVRSYKPGQNIKVTIDISANHQGYFQFRICSRYPASQLCLDQNLLKLTNGKDKYFLKEGTGTFSLMLSTPSSLKCSHCVFQWIYTAGNNWGICDDGNGQVGCGPQEEFRACADIAITNNAQIHSNVLKTSTKSFWSSRRKNTIEQRDKDFSFKRKENEKYAYSLKGKNSYSFFSFDFSPSKSDNYEKTFGTFKRKKLETSSNKIVTLKPNPSIREIKPRPKKKSPSTPFTNKQSDNNYTSFYNLKSGRSHSYFWIGENSKKKRLHSESVAVLKLEQKSFVGEEEIPLDFDNIFKEIEIFKFSSKRITQRLFELMNIKEEIV